MNIVITLNEEPIYLTPIIRNFIKKIPYEINYLVKWSVLKGKKYSDKLAYLLTLGITSIPNHLLKRTVIFSGLKLYKTRPYTKERNPLSVVKFCKFTDAPINTYQLSIDNFSNSDEIERRTHRSQKNLKKKDFFIIHSIKILGNILNNSVKLTNSEKIQFNCENNQIRRV